MINALTIDVEDYFQVSAFEREIDRRTWDDYESRVVQNTRRILALLANHGVKATFFILGWVADRFPELIWEIHQQGHEIGSHSYWHRLVYELSPEQFRHDLQQSRDVLESIINRRVTAYRAPSFSITNQSLWALEILAEEGFTVDSSIFPIHHDRYGIHDANPGIHALETKAGTVWEFPPSVVRFVRFNIPISGGGYFRLYPLAATLAGLRSVNGKAGRPFMFYVHPWEVDPEQPRHQRGSRLARARHYVNLARTEQKLGRLLSEFRFATLSEVISRSAGAVTADARAHTTADSPRNR